MGISHMDGETAVLDLVREMKPPFSPKSVVAEFAVVLKTYGIREVTGDAYSGEIIREIFRDNGISYAVSKRSKSEIYIDLLPMLNSGRVSLLDNSKLIAQLVGLERRCARGGRDVVDHPPHSHDDLINAAAAALTVAALVPEAIGFHVPTVSHVQLGDVREIGLPGVLSPAIYGDCAKPGGAPPSA